jgi:hypothetical protein
LVLAPLGGCWVPDVDVSGKGADLDHPCEVGYAAVQAPDGGYVCVATDGG